MEKIKDNKKNNTLKILEKCIIYIVLILISILEIILIFNENLWGDEAFSMLVAKDDWIAFWNTLIVDVHPPLYYIILKIMTILLGCNIQVAKIVSLLPIFLTNIIIINLAFKTRKNISIKKDILLILFLILTNLTSNFLYMCLEIRMYSWASFFVTISGIYAYKVYKKLQKRDIIIFLILSLGAALTHYFALIMEVVIYIYLFIALIIKNKKNIDIIIKISLYTILGYIWWVPVALRQFNRVQEEFWITFTPKDILKYIKSIIGLNISNEFEIIIFLLIGLIILNCIYKMIQNKCKTEEKENMIFSTCLISFPFVIIGIGSIFNTILTPIFTERYLTPAICLFWLGVINLLYYANFNKILISIFTIITILLGIFGYKSKYTNEMKTGTKEILNFMENNSKKEDTILTNIWDLGWSVLKYHFPENNVKLYVKNRTNIDKENIIWLFEDINKEIDKNLYKNNGYNIEYIYSGYIDNSYKFNLYKIYK